MIDTEKTVESVMSRKVHTISTRDTIRDAYDLISARNIRAVPVLASDESLAGIISERDIIRHRTRNILPRHADFYVKVSDVMTRKVRTFVPETPVKTACEKVVKWDHLQFPVVDENNHVVGLLGPQDLLRFFSENWENIVQEN